MDVKKLLLILLVLGGVLIGIKTADCEKATGRLKIRCANGNLENVANVVITISGSGLEPIEMSLTKSPSGYYEASRTGLPGEVELTFEAKAKDSAGKILFTGSNKAMLSGGGITNVVVSLTVPHKDISVPTVVLKTGKTQIQAAEKATIVITLFDDNAEVLCDISRSSGKGSLSNAGGTVTLVNNQAVLETILTPDILGGYTDIITVKANDQQGGFAVNKIAVTIEYNTQIEPKIEFTYVPPIGSGNFLEGTVQGVEPDKYNIAVYIKVYGGWWTKPYFAWPLTSIKSDLTWKCDVVTGGSDSKASHIAAFLIPNTYSPPSLGGSGSLPQGLYDNSAAYVLVAR